MIIPALGYLLLLALPLPPHSADAPIPPTPFDREFILELTAEDPVVIEGCGPTQVVEYLVEFEGTLHVWTESELDLFLRVDNVVEMTTLAEDDNSGGGKTPYLRLEVRAGDQLAVFVAGQASSTGLLALHLVAAPETKLTRKVGAVAQQKASESASWELVIAELKSAPGWETSEVIADALWDMGFDAYGAGELAACSVAWTQARRHSERTLPENHPDLFAARGNLAASLEVMGDLAGALALRKSVLEARERILPADHPDLLRARNNLAISLSDMGDLAGARALRESVLEARERSLPEDHPDLLKARNNLAISLSDMGDLAGARALEESVLEARERILPEDHPDLLTARANLASSLYAMGDLAGARALQESVLEAFERILPTDHPYILGARANLANSLSAMGDLAGARALEESVLDAYERSLPEDHPELLRARANLANSLYGMDDVAGARTIEESVLEAYERILPADHPDLLTARGNLASSLEVMGDLAGARALRESVLKAYERILPEGHPDPLSARANLADSLSDMGDHAGARALLAPQCAGMRARVLGSLALAPREVRQVVAAEGHRLAGVHFFSESAGSELRGTVFELTETMRLVSGEAARSLAEFTADPELAPILEEAATVRRTLNNLIAGAGRSETEPDEVSRELARLSLERDRLERDASRRLAERGVVTRPVEIDALAGALGKLNSNCVAVGYRRMARWFVDDKSKRLIKESDHLLAHVLLADGTLARIDLGLAADLEELVSDWRAAVGKPLLRGVAIAEEEGDQEAIAGDRLRERIIDPILAAAGEDVQQLFVCADDLVYLTPLDALPIDAEGNERVGDQLRIVNEVSFARLLNSEVPVESKPSLLSLGGVDYDAPGAAAAGIIASSAPISDDRKARTKSASDDENGDELRSSSYKNYRKLPQTRREAEGVTDFFTEVFDAEPVLLTRDETTKAALFKAAAGKRFVHIATHGWFAPESLRSIEDATQDSGRTSMGLEETVTGFAPMLLCGLALAGANNGRDSLGRVTGILTAEELCSLDLSQCELAVLSGCETNVGIRRAGQGIQSLQAALYAAGARTSITSLWEVDDAATRDLMETFYANLWEKKMGKAEALWEAKRALREDGDPPSNWAGWVLTGDPE